MSVWLCVEKDVYMWTIIKSLSHNPEPYGGILIKSSRPKLLMQEVYILFGFAYRIYCEII